MWYNNAADHIITFMGRSTSSQELSAPYMEDLEITASKSCYPAPTVLLGTQL